ncbi:hypothetical protein AWM70_08785 [Paenibacillus yonginensis]|uniref:Uncharacterized protein n=1 Tax=Paenibacillus yonginensis TaxID=1462996 RepID=A0A1B1MZR0_9BACL|nr:hypothetical protein [Paenibacillus yonginensis]ANS74670.1 hypothetical protein AWM70_08785 [Paenibacillus yonginensis]
MGKKTSKAKETEILQKQTSVSLLHMLKSPSEPKLKISSHIAVIFVLGLKSFTLEISAIIERAEIETILN